MQFRLISILTLTSTPFLLAAPSLKSNSTSSLTKRVTGDSVVYEAYDDDNTIGDGCEGDRLGQAFSRIDDPEINCVNVAGAKCLLLADVTGSGGSCSVSIFKGQDCPQGQDLGYDPINEKGDHANVEFDSFIAVCLEG